MAQSERKLTGGFCWVILLNEKRYAGKNHGYRGPMYSRLKNLVTLHDLAYSKPCSSHPTLNATSTYAPSLNWGGSLCQPTSPVARGCYCLARPVKKCGDLLLLQSIYYCLPTTLLCYKRRLALLCVLREVPQAKQPLSKGVWSEERGKKGQHISIWRKKSAAAAMAHSSFVKNWCLLVKAECNTLTQLSYLCQLLPIAARKGFLPCHENRIIKMTWLHRHHIPCVWVKPGSLYYEQG